LKFKQQVDPYGLMNPGKWKVGILRPKSKNLMF
jgi:hypothetical protein